MSGETLCFTCGQPADDPQRVNHLANGSTCPTCRDRLLDGLEGPLPADLLRATEAHEPRASLPDRTVVGPRSLAHRLRLEREGLEAEDDDDGFKPSA